MRRPIATIAAWLGGPPAIVLSGLIFARAIPLWEGIGWLAGCAAWSGAAGMVLARDLRRFSAALTAPSSPSALQLVTPGLTNLAQRIIQTIATERDTREAAATNANYSQSLLNRLPDALFQLDGLPGSRRIVWRNPAAVRIYGAEESALLRHPQLRAALAEAELADQPVRTTLSLATPVARVLDATVIRSGDLGRAAPVYILLTDRTRERELNQMRADFVANASHELRTPLTSLIGFIETLRGPARGDVEAVPRFLAIMAEQAERMQRIIADLLSLSRIEMSEHQPPSEQIDIGPVIRQVASFMDPILAKASTRLTLDIAASLPVVHGDSGQLTQVIGNLVDNAVKYSALKHGNSGGNITVSAHATPNADFPQPGILIEVIDDGPGIAREHLPRLTERFYRADKGRARAVGGTGLGLAIVKHVVMRHRGRLVIDSVEGTGTTCRVWLPAAAQAAQGSRRSA